MPNKPKPRVLLADVDGTLVTPQKELTAEALAAARELQAAGITMAASSSIPISASSRATPSTPRSRARRSTSSGRAAWTPGFIRRRSG